MIFLKNKLAFAWELQSIGNFATESTILGHTGLDAKKLTVKLHCKGVEVSSDEQQGSSNTRYYIRKENQFIYGKQNFFNGAIGVVPKKLDNYESTKDVPSFDLNKDVNPYWLYYYIARPEIYKPLESESIGTGSKRFHVRNFYDINLLVPSISEQRKMVDLYRRLDSLLTLHQRKYFYIFSTDFKNLCFFYYAWELHRLGEITYQSGEKNIEDLPLESYSVSNKDGFVNQKDQFKYGGLVTTADKSRSMIVTPHTFAYNPARLDVGSIGYQNLDKDVIISPMYEIFKADNSFADDRFLWHWLKSDIFNTIVVNNQEGGVRTCFNLPKFFEAKISISKDVDEQKKIGELFDKLDSEITLHQRKRLIEGG